MKKRLGAALALIWMIGASAEALANIDRYAKKLPSFSLKDPAGKTHTQRSVSKNGVVLVVTAPVLKEGGTQEAWDKRLTETKPKSKAKVVFLEDMEPSAFKGKAKKEMKKEYEPGQEPLLLLDESGKTREALKVPEKETVVLVYDEEGNLVHAEEGAPSAQAARVIWSSLP